jgi:hypothetical protein
MKTTRHGNPEDLVIRFGKHKGKTLGSLPRDYLLWLTSQEQVDIRLRRAAAEVLVDKHLMCRRELLG